MGCHKTKGDAIDQMVAISLSEGIEPGGERSHKPMKRMTETRALQVEDAEFRAERDGMTFRGYAAKFNRKSEPLPFRETILPGAFTRTLKSRNEIKAFVNHDTNMVIGSTRAGTLRLSQDEIGLMAEIDLPDTSYGRDLAVSVQRGDVSGMSFGFYVPKGGDMWNADYSERTISEIALHEVSPVTGFPAYRSTTASVRALSRLALRAEQDIEALSDALMALESGEMLTQDQGKMLKDTIEALTESLEQSEEVVEKFTAAPVAPPTDLLQKMLNLSMKKDML
jgi:HK97 family phage prohead protease